MSEQIHETASTTPKFQTELAAQLADLIPEAIADGKVDVEKLKELLDGDAADGSERFGLFWPGKKRALRAAQEPTTATLRPDIDNSMDWDTTKNVFIEGDNLEVLKILQKHYHARIKMIYIDPPYNTGKDFVYPDNYKEGLETYLDWTRQVNEEGKRLSTNADTEGRYHSNWLNMMYPRLKLARNLLTADGVIFISIDDHEEDNLRKLAGEVFGERNFLGTIIWRTATDNNPTNIATDHEYVLAYARDFAHLSNWEAPSDKAQLIAEQYQVLRAEHGDDNEAVQKALRKWIRNATKDGDVDLDGVAHYSYVDSRGVYYPGNSANTKPGDYTYDILHPVTGLPTVKPRNGWRWPKSTFDRASDMGDVHWGNDHTSVPRIKKRIETATQLLKSFYYEDNRATTAQVADLLGGVKAFDNPKSIKLLQRLLKFATDGDDVVLDFFAGSGSTAHAVMDLNARDGGRRRFIQVQLPEPTPENSPARVAGHHTIADVARARLRAASARTASDYASEINDRHEQIDLGFRSYELAETNFSKWKVSSDIDRKQLEQHLFDLRESSSADDASADNLLSEILLKQGYSLTESIAALDVDGLTLRSVGGGTVLAYLDEGVKPTLEQLRSVVDEDPARLIVLEDAFQGDDQLKTNVAQLCKSKGIELWTA
ncbi:site-specific DNA-methyltransferase [uncultured Microbacterium sp.]|uniref:site-specific DNA-methyltransferase n=1 Tax=uncultured Microbacterium sp. TaxID=191216 RepID=UPI00261DBE58|nr:site-specific DNA-methyltransferase [uncultured Microbacterium sp.]